MRSIILVCLIILISNQHLKAQESNKPYDIGKRYLEFYHKGDISSMAEYLNDNSEMTDPTGEVMGVELKLKGKESILETLKSLFAPIKNFEHQTYRLFAAGKYVISIGEVSYDPPGPANQGKISYTIITILEVHDGIVLKHTDYADYESVLR